MGPCALCIEFHLATDRACCFGLCGPHQCCTVQCRHRSKHMENASFIPHACVANACRTNASPTLHFSFHVQGQGEAPSPMAGSADTPASQGPPTAAATTQSHPTPPTAAPATVVPTLPTQTTGSVTGPAQTGSPAPGPTPATTGAAYPCLPLLTAVSKHVAQPQFSHSMQRAFGETITAHEMPHVR